jgi:uncharacterized membrane protein YuzA (DUF378 family)
MHKRGMKVAWIVSMVLIIIGTLSYALYGLFGDPWNVAEIFGIGVASSIIYALVGLAAVFVAVKMVFMKHKK